MKKGIAIVLALVIAGGLVGGAIYHKDDIKGWFSQEEDSSSLVSSEEIPEVSSEEIPAISSEETSSEDSSGVISSEEESSSSWYSSEETSSEDSSSLVSSEEIPEVSSEEISSEEESSSSWYSSEETSSEDSSEESSSEEVKYGEAEFGYEYAPHVNVGLDVSKSVPALTFTASLENATAEEVFASENRGYGMLIAPLSDCDALNKNQASEFDWKKAFATSDIKPLIDVTLDKNSEYVAVGEEKTTFSVPVPIEYGKHNTKYFGVMYQYEANEDGSTKYLYRGEPMLWSCNSALYMATEKQAYNHGCDADVGYVTYTDAELNAFRKIVNDAVDYANGLPAPTDDNSQLEFTTNLPDEYELELEVISEEDTWFKVEVEIAHDLDAYVAFSNVDRENYLFLIYNDGVIDQARPQSGLIFVYVGEQIVERCVNIVEASTSALE